MSDATGMPSWPVVGVLTLVSVVALQLLVRRTFAVALYRYATTGDAPGRSTTATCSRRSGARAAAGSD